MNIVKGIDNAIRERDTGGVVAVQLQRIVPLVPSDRICSREVAPEFKGIVPTFAFEDNAGGRCSREIHCSVEDKIDCERAFPTRDVADDREIMAEIKRIDMRDIAVRDRTVKGYRQCVAARAAVDNVVCADKAVQLECIVASATVQDVRSRSRRQDSK